MNQLFSTLALFSILLPVNAHANQNVFDDLPRKGMLGLPIQPVPAELASANKLNPGEGAIAGVVSPGMTAEKAGLKTGDLVLTMNDKPILFSTFVSEVRTLKSGEPVSFKIVRDGKTLNLSTQLLARPIDPGTDKYSVQYKSVVSNGKRMRTIVSFPKTPGKHPALFFIQGAGGNSYDYVMSGTGIVAPILHDFASNNFVTLRIEKPGVGDSEGGPFVTVDYNTEFDIYRQAMKQLRSLPEVDPDKIIIFGHSMGGAFGPMIASETPVRGLLMYGVVARTWHEYLIDIMRTQPRLGGRGFADIDSTVRNAETMFSLILEENKSPEEAKKLHPEITAVMDDTFPGGMFAGRATNFWRQLLKVNFASYWEKVSGHVLAVHGAADFVSCEVDHKLIADIVNSVHPGYGKFVTAPNSDHAFWNWATEAESYRHSPNGTYSPSFLQVIKPWVAEVLKTP
ncbi:MAG: alpha/beta fold hydrolase [Chthonomonadales bacterium]